MADATWRIKIKRQPTTAREVVELVMRARGIEQKKWSNFLEPDYDKDLSSPSSLPGVKKAVTAIKRAILASELITIYGDYDIDGLTATALLLEGLAKLGAKVKAYIPDRFEEGYGLNLKALTKLKDLGSSLVITVDCGITAKYEIDGARRLGLDIIVTDHHQLPDSLPDQAVALVNPKLLQKPSKLAELSGVGVAFTLLRALQPSFLKKLPKGQEKWLLDLVALGTICDCVSLIDENRLLVKYGLQVLAKSRRPGLQALARISGLTLAEVTTQAVGFILGPRLNAAGRLEHANLALKLLTTNNDQEADELAHQLNDLNLARRDLTETIFQEADVQAANYRADPILVLQDATWSHGVVGIVASRIAEKWHKPTIILQSRDKVSKGSARSIGGFDMIASLRQVDSLFDRYGGHQFAAGMTLSSAKIEALRLGLNKIARQNKNISPATIEADLVLKPELLSLPVYQEIQVLAPFGQANDEPQFATRLRLINRKVVGQDASHLQLVLAGSGSQLIRAIAFKKAHLLSSLKAGSMIDLVFKLRQNNWQGNPKLELEVVDLARLPQPAIKG